MRFCYTYPAGRLALNLVERPFKFWLEFEDSKGNFWRSGDFARPTDQGWKLIALRDQNAMPKFGATHKERAALVSNAIKTAPETIRITGDAIIVPIVGATENYRLEAAICLRPHARAQVLATIPETDDSIESIDSMDSDSLDETLNSLLARLTSDVPLPNVSLTECDTIAALRCENYALKQEIDRLKNMAAAGLKIENGGQ